MTLSITILIPLSNTSCIQFIPLIGFLHLLHLLHLHCTLSIHWNLTQSRRAFNTRPHTHIIILYIHRTRNQQPLLQISYYYFTMFVHIPLSHAVMSLTLILYLSITFFLLLIAYLYAAMALADVTKNVVVFRR